MSPCTTRSSPQSHLTCQRVAPPQLFSARDTTTRRPKRRPVRSSRNSREACSRLKHPHEVVWPERRLSPCTTRSLPQSHLTRQRALPRRLFPARDTTTRRPKRRPVMSSRCSREACSRRRQPHEVVWSERRWATCTTRSSPQSHLSCQRALPPQPFSARDTTTRRPKRRPTRLMRREEPPSVRAGGPTAAGAAQETSEGGVTVVSVFMGPFVERELDTAKVPHEPFIVKACQSVFPSPDRRFATR